MGEKWCYDKPPAVRKQYERWKVLGPPLPYIVESMSYGKKKYQTKWKVLCECECGRRDLIELNNLERGLSGMCRVCGRKKGREPRKYEAFGESKTLKEWLADPRCMPSCLGTLYTRIQNGFSGEALFSMERNYRSHAPRPKMRKLNNEQVLEIIDRLRSGERGQDLAAEFNVSETTISHIKTGKMYSDVRVGKKTGR